MFINLDLHKYTNFYQSQNSSTYLANNLNFSLDYLNGLQVSGFLSMDVVSLGGFKIVNQTFGEATFIKNPSMSTLPTFDV